MALSQPNEVVADGGHPHVDDDDEDILVIEGVTTSSAEDPSPTPKRLRPSDAHEDDKGEGDGDEEQEEDADGGAMAKSSTADANALPRATVAKLIADVLPAGVQCPRETRDLILQCALEFIHLVTGEANGVCERRNKRTIAPEHILEALKALGFGDYCGEAESALSAHDDRQRLKRSVRDRHRDLQERSGLTPDELERQQAELFQQARQRLLSNVTNQPAAAGSEDTNKDEK